MTLRPKRSPLCVDIYPSILDLIICFLIVGGTWRIRSTRTKGNILIVFQIALFLTVKSMVPSNINNIYYNIYFSIIDCFFKKILTHTILPHQHLLIAFHDTQVPLQQIFYNIICLMYNKYIKQINQTAIW